jgi:hypothetical protein
MQFCFDFRNKSVWMAALTKEKKKKGGKVF